MDSQNNTQHIVNEGIGRWPRVIVITGPTASGKSALAVEVAERLGAHIISADSRQIYCGMPVTTAVPSADDRRRVPHHLLEFLNPSDYYSAAMFEADALRLIAEAANRNDSHIVVCGGSMMYIDALLYGLDDLPTVSPEVRQRVKEMYRDLGMTGLQAYLLNLDPHSSSVVDLVNPRRLMHAVELCLQSGRPVSELFKCRSETKRPFAWVKYALDLPREDLFGRINRRVDLMVEQGMEEEARHFYPQRHLNSLNTIGFKEWFAYFDGEMDKATTIARIAKNTRVYSKKQLTWLARRDDTTFLRPSEALSKILSAT